MAGITIKEAEKHLKTWLAAELELASGGQSYRIGTRTLTRADLKEVRNELKFWEEKVNQLSRKGRNRVFRCVPRDL